MIRARFYTDPSDYRPVKWPPPGPYWCTGYAVDDSYAVVVAYADDEDQLREFWPDAVEVDAAPATEYTFTGRFPRPEWWPIRTPAERGAGLPTADD